MEQVDENVVYDEIKAGTIQPLSGRLMILDGAITFEGLGLKPFREEVDGLGPASMAVVRIPRLGEFLLTLLDYNSSPYGGIDVACQGTPTKELLAGFLAAADLSLFDATWVSPLIRLPIWFGVLSEIPYPAEIYQQLSSLPSTFKDLPCADDEDL